jgi:predicted permease
MLLARGLVREREIAIRLAVGAGRGRIIRQLMTENLLLALLASIAALFVGRVAARLLLSFTSAPAAMRIHTDWRIVLACAALGLAATFAFGLAPALQMVKGGAKATRFRKALVSVQVATSCVLLILSSFFLRAIQQSMHTQVAFDSAGLALIDPMFYMHSFGAAEARQAAADVSARLRGVPGVESVALLTNPPLRRPRIVYSDGAQLYVNQVDPAYFTLMRLPLRIGHLFGLDDPDAVVIGESTAHKLWPGASPLGRTIHLGPRDLIVAGVVKDSGLNLILFPESVEVYLPIPDRDAVRVTILVRTAAGGGPGTATLRSAAAITGLAPLVFTLQGMIDDRFESIRKMVRVVGSLAGVASLLALIGIFGLLAFTVAQRTREIGVRMALGARGPDVLRLVLGQHAFPFGMGAACGVALAAAIARIVRNSLYGYAAFDLTSVSVGLLAFVLVALAAAIEPARRALRIAPASALRHE